MCYAQKEMNIDKKWMMMIAEGTYVDIQDIRPNFGDEICAILRIIASQVVILLRILQTLGRLCLLKNDDK